MRPSEDMDKLIKNLRYKASTETHDRILGNVMKALDESERQRTGAGAPDIWRKIMKSPITKLAAAAIIIIAASIGLNQIISTTPAFAEIIQPLLTARTATFKMTMALENGPTQSFDCMFMEPMHMRQISSGAIVISDLQEGKILTLIPEQKKAMVMEMENIPENKDQSELNMFHAIRKHIQEAKETEDESVSFLGEKQINGMTAIGYHVQRLGVDITVWADPRTKLPVQMENKMGPVTYTMTDIVFNVKLDETLFSLVIPEGYTVRTMQVDASKPTEEDLIVMFQIWSEHMDGSLPSVLDMYASMEFVKYQRKKMKEKGQEPSEESVLELQKTIMKLSRGGTFVQGLPAESNWHYAGAGVIFGDAEKAIFWYRPEGSATYRVIYGDLSVKDVSPENLPK
jgi:outer membrane lipoprotein-sorting protein